MHFEERYVVDFHAVQDQSVCFVVDFMPGVFPLPQQNDSVELRGEHLKVTEVVSSGSRNVGARVRAVKPE